MAELTTSAIVSAIDNWKLNGDIKNFEPHAADRRAEAAAVAARPNAPLVLDFPIRPAAAAASGSGAAAASGSGAAASGSGAAASGRPMADLFEGGASRANILAYIKSFLTTNLTPLNVRPSIDNVIDNAPADIYNGVQIIHVPYVDEILRRAAYAQAMRASQLTQSSYADLFESEGYKTMPKYKSDELLALPEFKGSPVQAKKWDDDVTALRNALASPTPGSNRTNFSAANTLNAPNTLTLSTYSRYPPGVKAALVRKRSPPYGMNGLGANYAQGRLSVSVQNGGKMQGGSLSAHAPLYPRVVMNGGAHPLAVLEGGVSDQWNKLEGSVFDPVSQLNTKIDRQLAELDGLSNNRAGSVNIGSEEIKKYSTRVGKELGELRKKLYEINNVNTALAAAPLTDGVKFDFNDLALKGKEINEKAYKVSKGYVNLAQIAEHLEELLKRMKPAELKGGLHDALKH